MVYLDKISHTHTYLFNIAQTLVCKMVTRLHLASFWSDQGILVKMLITLEPHGMF